MLQLGALNEVMQAISRSSADLTSILHTVLDGAIQFGGGGSASLYLYRDGAFHFTAGRNLTDQEEARARTPIVSNGTNAIVSRAIHERRAVQADDGETTLAVPLLGDGGPVGVLALMRRSGEAFTERQVAAVTNFADQAAVAIENARLLREARDSRQVIERDRGLMQSVLDNIGDGIILCEPDGTILFRNNAVAKINGIPASAFAGFRNIADAIRWQFEQGHLKPADQGLDADVARLMAHFRSDAPYESIRQQTGGTWVEVRWHTLPDGRRLSIHRDVTALKQRELEAQSAREALEQESAKLTTILDNLPDGVMLYDERGTILHTNNAFYELNGFPAAVFSRFGTVREALHWQIASGRADRAHDTIEEQVDERLDVFLSDQPSRTQRHRNDRWLDVNWLPLPDGRHLLMHRDVTILKEQEIALREAHDSAEHTRALMETVLDNMTDGVVLWDADTAWQYANQAACEMHQTTPERLGRIRYFENMMDSMIERGMVDQRFRTAAIERFRRADGTPTVRAGHDGRLIEATLHRLTGGGTLGVFRDITTLKQQEERLKLERDSAEAARAEAEAANQAKSTFLATMSHEIRTPMNGVLGMMEVLEHQELSAGQKATLSIMRESATSLARIIDDILDFSKIEAGRMELEETPFSLSEVVTSAVRTLRPRAVDKGLRMVSALDPGSADTLIGDPTRLRQILFNLLGNAVKFTEKGSIHIEASTDAIGGGRQRVTLVVSDTGIGMDEDQRSRLFQPFSQGDSSTTRRFGGSGLGLSIVRRLAQLMGGDISVDSQPNKGTTFTVTLTLRAAGDQIAESEQDEAAVSLAHHGGTVLVVDDHPVNREVLVRQLDLLGLHSESAVDGVDALAMWQPGKYAAVLADIHMPRMDGYGLTSAIHTRETEIGAARTPIIAVTANAMRGEEDRCIDAGMDAYIPKPVSLNRLRDTLLRWLQVGPSRDAAPISVAIKPDRDSLRAWMGNDDEAINGLLSRFYGSASDALRTMTDRLAQDDLGAIQGAAGELHSAALLVGAQGLADLAQRIEQVATTRDRETCVTLLQALRVAMDAVKAPGAA